MHRAAVLDPSVEVGAYAVIDAGVVLGPGCEVGPHVYITGRTRAGTGNRFHAGCVIGDAPQDLKYRGEATNLVIGNRNTFREHVTVHRSTTPETETVVGSDNYLMANSHVGHNSVLGNRVILANGVLLGGHVRVDDRAFLSGNCLVHQFARVGTLAIMQGGAAISKDLAPYTVARGVNRICGLNTVGLRRAGVTSIDRLMLRRLYHALFRSGERFSKAFERAKGDLAYAAPMAKALLEFIEASQRGICHELQPRGRGSSGASETDE